MEAISGGLELPREAYTVEVDAIARVIVITGRGRATTEDTVALIARHRQTFRDNAGYGVIYDSAALDIESSAPDMVRVADALFSEGGAHFGRFAVVVPERRAGLAMMFTALAQTHGIQANVFLYLADARRWVTANGAQG